MEEKKGNINIYKTIQFHLDKKKQEFDKECEIVENIKISYITFY